MTDPIGVTPNYTTPGWYLDPDNPLQRRWWNGQAWTGETMRGEMWQEQEDLRRYDASRTAMGTVPPPVTQYAYSMTWWAHILWFLTSAATFGVGILGWIGWGIYRHYHPRRVSVSR